MSRKEPLKGVRNRGKIHFSLRTRLIVFVTLEMLVCILIAFGIDKLINWCIPEDWNIPLVVELLFVCGLVGIFVTNQLSKFFFDPIKKLRKAMDEVAQGDFSVRLEGSSRSKEIMDIYAGFNLMAHELCATEILQTDFLSNVSHEFKTPINAIEGYSTLLQDSDNLNDDQRQYIEKILFNSQRLSSLVGSILLLSKLENQQIQTNQTNYRLDEQIRQSVVALQPSWESKEIDLDVELDRVDYLGCEPMMRHVWDNLISNAIKFSPYGGVVKIRLFNHGQSLDFFVEDQGEGVAEEAKKHIFDKFYQGDSSHKHEGNGLGLALVKRILTIEKGQVAVENLPHRGCRFTVTLQAKRT